MFAVMRVGYDFDPQVRAICDDLERARVICDQEDKEITPLPWNGTVVIEIPLNESIDFDTDWDVLYAPERVMG